MNKQNRHCEVCGYTSVLDLHHEGVERIEHLLCPNCHALITREILTLEELLEGKTKIRHNRDAVKYQSKQRRKQRARIDRTRISLVSRKGGNKGSGFHIS